MVMEKYCFFIHGLFSTPSGLEILSCFSLNRCLETKESIPLVSVTTVKQAAPLSCRRAHGSSRFSSHEEPRRIQAMVFHFPACVSYPATSEFWKTKLNFPRLCHFIGYKSLHPHSRVAQGVAFLGRSYPPGGPASAYEGNSRHLR